MARVISFFGSRVKKTVDQLYRSTSFKKKERNFLCVVREGSMNDLSGSFPFINQDGNSFSRIQSVHPLVSLFHKQEKIFQPTQRCQDGKDWQSFKKKIENFCCAKKERKDFCYSQRYSCRWWTPHAHAGTKDVARGWRPIDNRRQRAVKRDGGGIRFIQNRRIFESARVGLSVELTTTT